MALAQKLIRLGLIIYAISSTTTISGMGLGVFLAFIGLVIMFIRVKMNTPSAVAATPFEKRGINILPEDRNIIYCVIFFLCVVTLSTFFSYKFDSSIKRLVGLSSEVLLLFAVLSVEESSDGKFFKTVLNIILIAVAFESIYGILQYFTGLNVLGSKGITKYGRIMGTLGYYNSLGAMTGIILPVIFSKIIYVAEKRFLFCIIFILVCTALVFTFTRGAWIGALVAIGIISVIRNKKLLLIPLAIIVLLFLIPQTRTRIIEQTFRPTDGDIQRVFIWESSITLLKERPFLGWGLDTYKEIVEGRYKKGLGHFHSHNIYIGLFQETGIFGLLSFLLIVYFTVRRIIHNYKNNQDLWVRMMNIGFLGSLVVFLIHGFVDYTIRAESGYFFWFIIGMVMLRGEHILSRVYDVNPAPRH
ncbi:MAG: O-antigen ligase family protein [Elusimicrobiota bacterium]